MITATISANTIKGFEPTTHDYPVVSHLQFADDVLIL